MNLFEYKHYYDTTEAGREAVAEREQKCGKQEREILALFVAGQYLSQPAIRRAYLKRYGRELQIASCSRSFTNLTNFGKLRKTDVKVAGEFGREVYTWVKV